MNRPALRRIQAVGPHYQPIRLQDPAHLGQKSVLLPGRRGVMQHGEQRGSAEASGFKRQPGAITVHDRDISPDKAPGEMGGERPVNLNGGQPSNCVAQHVGRQARARANLEYVIAQLIAGQYPGQQFVSHVTSPLGA